MKFKSTNFARIVAITCSIILHIIGLPFFIIYWISSMSDSDNDLLWKIYGINNKIYDVFINIIELIYQDICGWYYGIGFF